jgi:lysozyme family protein
VTIDEMIEAMLAKEGKYSNNPKDSGGETNWGITLEDARANGYFNDMKTMPRETAKQIYYRKYITSTGIDRIIDISRPISYELFDIAVNMGTYRAGEFCQRLLNALNRGQRDYFDIKVDGQMGSATRTALVGFLSARGVKDKHVAETVFIKGLNAMQGEFYISLAERRPKDEEFLFGWLLHRA